LNASTHPFTALAVDEDDTAEQATPEDTIASKPLPVIAALSSVVELASTGPSSSSEVVAETSVVRAAVPPDLPHRFFQHVRTRPPELLAHLERHYSSASTVCACELFPVYSAKSHCDEKLPPEFDKLCLVCVYSLCSTLAAPALNVLYQLLSDVDMQIACYYGPCYEDSEIRDINAAITEKRRKLQDARNARAARQFLARLGVVAARV
jgi:hypothetical protein